jgi:hypothetical protein
VLIENAMVKTEVKTDYCKKKTASNVDVQSEGYDSKNIPGLKLFSPTNVHFIEHIKC